MGLHELRGDSTSYGNSLLHFHGKYILSTGYGNLAFIYNTLSIHLMEPNNGIWPSRPSYDKHVGRFRLTTRNLSYILLRVELKKSKDTLLPTFADE